MSPIDRRMDTDNIHTLHPAGALALLNPGEAPMPLAPTVALPDGTRWIPQHYLLYRHDAATVAALLADVDVPDDLLLFSGHDDNGLYLQAGTLGPDNYKRKQAQGRRIVYGRKWRIEPYTPTSEIIQTAFLAIKKACEHDVRELLTITDPASGRTGTPFSTHVDLPLTARFPELVRSDAPAGGDGDIAGWLDGVRFDGRAVLVDDVTRRRNGQLVVDLRLGPSSSLSPRAGFDDLALTIVLATCDEAALLHALMEALVRHSDRLVDERFRYRGFARFGRALDPRRIAALSVMTRGLVQESEAFAQVRRQLNHDVDARKAPALGADRLSARNRALLARETNLGGHLPADVRAAARRS